jgi:ABC-type glycerol-3-phosphate transport system substrate-binding protein
MRKQSILFGLALAMAALISACGGGDGGGGTSGSSGSGTVSMNVTDAKPMLPTGGVESVTVTFDEVSVHRSGGGWTTLATATRPYTIDLYQFSNGARTQFVPPVQLESGKYTQVRIGVASGIIRISGVRIYRGWRRSGGPDG